jgi:hypothetical protein
MRFTAYALALLGVCLLHLSACLAFHPLGVPQPPNNKPTAGGRGTGAQHMNVAWFPMSLRDLDIIGQQTMDAGADLQSDHPGFKVRENVRRTFVSCTLRQNTIFRKCTLPFLFDSCVPTQDEVYRHRRKMIVDQVHAVRPTRNKRLNKMHVCALPHHLLHTPVV